MKQRLPDVNEKDRFIAGHGDDESYSTQDKNKEHDVGEPRMNEDGSAEFDLDKDEQKHTGDFQENLADVISKSAQREFSYEYMDSVAKDKDSRTKRDRQYEDGLRRTGLGDDAPGGASFSGSSRVVHPILAESCIDFASRAIKELFPPSGPVKSTIFGTETEAKIELANKKTKFMNWQVTTNMGEYRSQLEQLLTQLPMGGSQYQKFWYDERMKRPRTEFVPIDDVYLPYAASDFYTAQRVTHIQHITEFEFNQRVDCGLYVDIVNASIGGDFTDQSAASVANDKIEGRERDAYNDDGIRDVYEIMTWYAFEDDKLTKGEMAPYIVTIDVYTETILSIYRNWDENDQSYQKLDWFVEWKFIPWRGAYAIGLPHLIGGISGALTGTLRALMDAAHINNSQTLIKLRGGKVSGQNIEVEPTQIAEIEGPAGTDDIRKVIMSMPYNAPSPVLMQLLDWLTNAGKGVIATAEESMKNIGDRTPVGTTMAMVEQGSTTYSAIHARLHYSQAKALRILCRINSVFLDEEEVIEDLGELIISKHDFKHSLDISPVSDPDIFSETQRFAQMQGVAQVVQMFPTLQFDQDALARRMLSRMRVEGIDELLPAKKKPPNMNPVAENLASVQGTHLLALPKQNHMAHLFCHLDFAMSPTFSNPAFAMNILPTMIEHCIQHIGFAYADMMEKSSNYNKMADKMPTNHVETSLAHVHDTAMAQFEKEIGQAMKQFTAMQAAWQKIQPPPQQDPAIAATLQAAMAEISRKQQKDNADIQLKQKEVLQIRPQENQLKEQNLIDRNTATNEQKQQTEIMKNRDDNETAKIIQEMKESSLVLQTQIHESNAADIATGEREDTDTDSKLEKILDSINNQPEPQQAQPTNITVNHAPGGTISPPTAQQ